MLSAKFILWAKSASVDSQTNSLSIFEVIEELTTPQLPGVLSDTKLVTLFERNPEKDPSVFDCQLIVKNADKTIGSQKFQLDFKGLKRNRLVIMVPPFKLEKEGNLTFSFTHKNKEVATYKIDVVKIK